MSEPERVTATPVSDGEKKQPYEPPRIVWREAYQPIAFGISCAKQPGNPGCNPGPANA